ncbi:MAG: zinc-ribbon domain containing protein [Patescibacteria group bacterium]
MSKCKNCNQEFTITATDRQYYLKIGVPEPTWCPDCRLWRKMVWRNFSRLYQRKSSLSGQNIISEYSDDKELVVYSVPEWQNDNFDPLTYGRDFDFSRPFFQQWAELFHTTPLPAAFNDKTENCEYNLKVATSKNCYYSYSIHRSEDVYYSLRTNKAFRCFDSSYIFSESDCMYQSHYCHNCSFSSNLYWGKGCSDCHYCVDCSGCQSCLFCNNLRNQHYCIFNKQVSQEQFEQEKAKLINGSYEQHLKNLEIFKKEVYSKAIFTVRKVSCENCQGDSLTNCANLKNSFNVGNVTDGANLYEMSPWKGNHDSMDIYIGGVGELMYECSAYSGNSYDAQFCLNGRDASFLRYCFHCFHSQYCFGCISLKGNKFCILNKQYSEDEYPKMVAKIKDHMIKTGEYGEFFPPELSPFGYNETTANDQFPMTKDEVLARGLKWKEKDLREYLPATHKLSDNIKDTPDMVMSAILACELCGKNYKIIKPELDFHRQFNYALPRHCPGCRLNDLRQYQRELRLYSRECVKCGTKVDISIPSGRPEKIYCEECYQKEIY